MPELDSSGPRGAGGGCRPPRSASRPRLALALLLLAGVAGASTAAAAPAPRLRALLKASRTAVAGSVSASTSYDDDRVAVVALTAMAVFKGKGEPPLRLSLVELHEGSNSPPLASGEQGLAFLRPAPMTTYLERTLPPASYQQLVPGHGAFIAAADAADAARQIAIMQRVLRIAGGATLSAGEVRQLTFDLLASDSPVLVEDGAAGLTDLGRNAILTEPETNTLRTALLRKNLSNRVRIALIKAVASAHLVAMVPDLQKIDSPPQVMEAAWRALDALGAGATEDQLQERLASSEASTRSAAARAMLQRSGADAVQAVTPLAVSDNDPQVRLAVVEALGTLKDPAALPVLEQAFVDPSESQRQAAARGIRAVGGQQAIDTLGRLAVNGPVESQRYAVVVLMTLDDPNTRPVLDHLAKSHPDAKTRDLIEHGFPTHHH